LGAEDYVKPVVKRRDPNQKSSQTHQDFTVGKKTNKMNMESDENSLKFN
jgi:hypothetical protein